MIPTQAPSKTPIECRLDDSGTFGTTTTSRETIVYYYEVETKAGSSISDVIEKLEDTIGNAILENMFEGCISSGGRKLAGTNSIRRHLEISGLSSSPGDMDTNGTSFTFSLIIIFTMRTASDKEESL